MVEPDTTASDPPLAASGKPGDIIMTDALRKAIATAYDVFALYGERFTAQVCQCPCCFIEADREKLIKLSLREINGHLLEQYSWSVHGYDDDGPFSYDLRYLLPRYFDLFAKNDPRLHNAPEFNLMRLGRTAWRKIWPAAEVEAIDRYFDTLLQVCLTNSGIEGGWSGRGGSGDHCALQIDGIIVMAMCAGGDVTRLLQIWDAAPDPAAALHLADLRFSLQTDEHGTRLSNPYLDPDFLEAALAVGAFITSPRSTSRIEAAFFKSTDPGAQSLLSDALFLA